MTPTQHTEAGSRWAPVGEGGGAPALIICAWVGEAQECSALAASLGWVLPLLSHPPCSPGWAEGENRLACGTLPPLPPVPGASHLGHGMEELASVLGQPLAPHRAVLPERWAFGEGLREPLIPTSPQALDTLDPTLFENKGRGRGWGVTPLSQPSSPLPQEAGSAAPKSQSCVCLDQGRWHTY